jgi:amino acid permease
MIQCAFREALTNVLDSGTTPFFMESGTEIEGERRSRRKRRSFWKRRQFWITLFAILLAVLMALWLISRVGSFHIDVD